MVLHAKAFLSYRGANVNSSVTSAIRSPLLRIPIGLDLSTADLRRPCALDVRENRPDVRVRDTSTKCRHVAPIPGWRIPLDAVLGDIE